MPYADEKLITAEVESFSHTSIADEQLDTLGFPLGDNFFRGVIPVVIKHIPGARNGSLASISSGHGRSYEVDLGSETLDEPVWADQHGNVFTALNTKGNNFSRPDVIRSGTAPSGYIPYGLQEDDAFTRNVIASNLARAAGVDTEWILRVEEPKHLLFDGNFVEPEVYKGLLLRGYLGMSAVGGAEGTEKPRLSEEEAMKIAKAINPMNFFVTLRAMSTNLRIADLLGKDTVDQERRNKVYEAYNLIAPYRQEDLELLDLPVILEPGDETTYFTEILPKLLGCNLARLHAAGMIHYFPHPGNVNGLGGIVDFDSVRGEVLKLGDKPITPRQKARDLTYVLDPENAEGHRFKSFLERLHGGKGGNIFIDNLLEAYCKVRSTIAGDNGAKRSALEVMIELGDKGRIEEAALHIVNLAHAAAREPIEARVDGIAEQRIPLDTRKLAGYLYDVCLEGHEPSLWGDILTEKPPTLENLEQALQLWFGKRDANGEVIGGNSHLVHWELFQTYIEPFLLKEVREIVKAQVKPEIKAIRRELAGTGLEKMSPSALTSLFYLYLEDVHGYNQLVLPNAEEFWAAMKAEFTERYAGKVDFSVVPEQEFIKPAAAEELEPYFFNWDFQGDHLMHTYAEVPLALLEGIVNLLPEPTIVGSAKDVLEVEINEREDVVLAITDGKVLHYYDGAVGPKVEEGISKGYPYSYSTELTPQPKYALFLIMNLDDRSYKLVFNKLGYLI